jgi:hypothetical protein
MAIGVKTDDAAGKPYRLPHPACSAYTAWLSSLGNVRGEYNDGSRANTLIKRLLAGGLYGGDTVARHASENGDHLPIGVIGGLKPLANPLHRRRQNPFAKRCAIAKSAGFTGQDRHIMPGIIDCLAAAEAAAILGDGRTVLLDDNPTGFNSLSIRC